LTQAARELGFVANGAPAGAIGACAHGEFEVCTRIVMAHEPQRIPGTISNLQLLAHVSAMDALGVDTARILEMVGLRRECFADPGGRFPTGLQFALWDATLKLTGDPAIGLRVGQRMSCDAFGAFGYALTHSGSLRELIGRAQKFARLIDDLGCVDVLSQGELVRVRLSRACGYPIADQAVDCLFAAVVGMSRQLFSFAEPMPSRARLAHRPWMDVATYEQYLGCPVELDAAHHEMEGPAAWLDLRPTHADPKLGQLLHEHATLMLERLPQGDPLLQSVRAQLSLRLAQGDVGLATLARALHMSERTLRRRLSEHGTSYQALLDELRAEVACKLVERAAQPFDVIAQQIGFADTSSFFHAFKRWTGKTPAQFRREQRA
jgi:AraC-like DNA-binding protein